jgi:ABC-type transport system involved in multi-copper enzyme maturation permease subunit
MRLKKHMTLPVLFRELSQLASQRSTYVMRGIVAAVFYLIAFVTVYTTLKVFQNVSSQSSISSVLGQGKTVLIGLTWAVTVGIYLIFPAMVVGTITTERENGTLDLMLITRLNPWEIVFQKLFARLVPMLSLLLLTAPFMAVAYSLGGISAGDIAMTLTSWLMTSVKLAALSIMCSSFCRSTVTAFFTTYGVLFAMTVAIPFLGIFQLGWFWVMIAGTSGGQQGMGAGGWIVLVGYLVSLGVTVGYLAIARVFIARAGRRSSGGIKASFRKVDGALEKMNRKVGKRRWGRVHASLPDFKPIAWRERAAAVVCTPRHLFRLVVAINIPFTLLLLIILAYSMTGNQRECAGFSVAMAITWVPVVLALCIYVANLMSKERSNQTMEVLLTTPLSEREILTQKLAAVPRLCIVLAMPLAVTVLFEAVVERGAKNADLSQMLGYTVWSFIFSGLYLYTVTWITFSCSL